VDRLMTFRREVLLGVAACVFLVAAVFTVYALSPTRLRVAVPQGDPTQKLMLAWAQALSKSRAGLRLEIMPASSFEDAAQSLQSGKAELAIARPEKAMPDRGLTVAVLSIEAIVFLVPPGKAIDAIEDLSGRRVGMLRRVADAPEIVGHLTRVLRWKQPPSIVSLDEDDLDNRETLERIDAILHIAPVTTGEFNSLLTKLDGGRKNRAAKVIIAEDAATLVQRDPIFEEVELEAGSLSSKPKRPDEKSSTIGTSLRLLAHADLGRDTVYEITRSLFENRTRLARVVPFANSMEPPESSTSALLPVHLGAIDYIERDQQTFFSRYADLIYIGASILGGLVSAVAAIGQHFLRKRREKIDEILSALTSLLRKARVAGSRAELNSLAAEVDGLVTEAVEATLHRTTDVRAMSALVLTTESVRHAIDDRRNELSLDGKRTIPRHAPSGRRESSRAAGTSRQS
jgi:TRAP-type uncharacterized transport system substrate-binding protein